MSRGDAIKDKVRRLIKDLAPNFQGMKMNPYNQNNALDFHLLLIGIITEEITCQMMKYSYAPPNI